MKIKVLCLLLLASFSLKAGIYEETIKYIVDSPGTPIYQTDIATGAVGYNITTPGRYYLNENIEDDTLGNATAIIQISTSGVTFDLNGYTIRSVNAATTNLINVTTSAEKNITIKNGFLDGQAQATQGIKFNYSANRYQSIIIDDINITACTNGLLLKSLSSGFVKNCIMNLTDRGIEYNDCVNIITNNVLIGNSTGYGFLSNIVPAETSARSKGLIFENCVAKDIGNIGFGLFGPTHNIFRNCEAIECNTRGFFLYNSTDLNGYNTFIRCLAKGCTTNGFESTNQLFNAFIDCEAIANQSGFKFFIGKQACVGCEASNNSQYGFIMDELGASSYTVFKDCLTTNNSTGFVANTRDDIIVGCHAQNDTTGFDQPATTDNLFIYNFSNANTTNYTVGVSNTQVGTTPSNTGDNLY